MHLTITTPTRTSSASKSLICAVALLDRLGRRQRVHAGDQHVLVVGPVEDADVAGLGHALRMRHRKSCCALLPRRRLEAGDLHALRVDQADGVAQHPALAGGVHALQHEEHPAGRTGRALGPEPLLQVGQLVTEGGQGGRALRLAAVEPGLVVGRDRGQVDRAGWQPVEVGVHGHIMSDPPGGSSSSSPSSSRTTANARPAG